MSDNSCEPVAAHERNGAITALLEATDGEEELLALVYGELRRLARAKLVHEQPGQTIQATELVHEAWLRLGGQCFVNRRHFFSAASEAMRRILVDRARRRGSQRRGGGWERVDVDLLHSVPSTADDTELLKVLELHEALSRFEQHEPGKAELVRLRYFVGLTGAEVAQLLDTSLSTVNRDWAYAKAWLYRELSLTDAKGIAFDQSPRAQSYV